MLIDAKNIDETTLIAQEEAGQLSSESPNDVIVSLAQSGGVSKKSGSIIKRCRSKKPKIAIPVYITASIVVLLLIGIQSFQATYNRFASRALSEDEISEYLIQRNNKISLEYLLSDTVEHITLLKSKKLHLPQQFDARLQWPLCWSVHQVANQGGCGSCWAVSAASVMSDRLCIATNYSNQNQISAEDLLSCCAECGGCQGSYWALSAFIYWRNYGLVTGGDYGSFQGCKPYTTQPNCGSPCSFQNYQMKVAPACRKTCQPLYNLSYEEDLIRNDPTELIKREMYLHGPILACFTAREDFQHYGSGIYQTINSTMSKKLYGHCAKLLGWGEESNMKYWLYMNTWGRDWGDYGFFRVSQSELPEEAIAGML
ncbi:unnamed protein product [Litomosoides sigmodontis]|uniref:Peptidase C1A papain C-terminal domain-containing protein n=1 Tax=Litomosoides sigmodontis TaxID=42156 RepID=A0A3P6TMG6_LITSI|nr:unnamed protein product [Litomosoides sigmodontis]